MVKSSILNLFVSSICINNSVHMTLVYYLSTCTISLSNSSKGLLTAPCILTIISIWLSYYLKQDLPIATFCIFSVPSCQWKKMYCFKYLCLTSTSYSWEVLTLIGKHGALCPKLFKDIHKSSFAWLWDVRCSGQRMLIYWCLPTKTVTNGSLNR